MRRTGSAGLNALWKSIDDLEPWEQVPLVLTFDTGVVPCQVFRECADLLTEFDTRLPAPADHVNHVPAVAELLRSQPEAPLIGMYGTSVSENPFQGPWDEEAEEYAGGIPLSEMYVLGRHRQLVAAMYQSGDTAAQEQEG